MSDYESEESVRGDSWVASGSEAASAGPSASAAGVETWSAAGGGDAPAMTQLFSHFADGESLGSKTGSGGFDGPTVPSSGLGSNQGGDPLELGNQSRVLSRIGREGFTIDVGGKAGDPGSVSRTLGPGNPGPRPANEVFDALGAEAARQPQAARPSARELAMGRRLGW